jgi:Cu/Ag efflux pump CusA
MATSQADLRVAQTKGFPTFDIRLDRDAIARLGLTVQDVADTLEAALGGRPAGLLFSGDKRFQIVVRAPNSDRNDADAIGMIPVMLPARAGEEPRSVRICVILIFGVLYMALGSAVLAMTVFTAVPLAIAGGVSASSASRVREAAHWRDAGSPG